MISVIIPTYKSPDALELCLKSAIAGQKNKNQIIVVVDGHYDINKDVLMKYEMFINILDLGSNAGLSRATNLGVFNAQHEKILIVNDDNVFPTNWDIKLENDWNHLSKENRIVITPNQIEPNPSMFKQFVIKDLGTTPAEFDLEKFQLYEETLSKSEYSQSGSTLPVFMKKQDFIMLGGWDENYTLGMVADWDFFLKCNLADLKMIRTNSTHFYHFTSISTNGSARQEAERSGHEYAKYKWGSYIQHDLETNLKVIKN